MDRIGPRYEPPIKRPWKLAVALPNPLVADVPHPREKTTWLGFLGRALGMQVACRLCLAAAHAARDCLIEFSELQ